MTEADVERAQMGESAYERLRQRAYEFVLRKGGCVSEHDLIAHVFGSVGSLRIWQPLLRQVLGGDERLVMQADGRWTLRHSPIQEQLDFPVDFIAIDVETTGLRPARQRIIEIGAVRYHDGRPVERFSLLINPERHVPQYITKLTGIRDLDLLEAPIFSRIAGQLLAFLGDAVLVGYNVGFDLAFLNLELRRAGWPPLANPTIDVLPLVRQLQPTIGRWGLDDACRAFGLSRETRHRALADAEATAELYLALRAKLWTSMLPSSLSHANQNGRYGYVTAIEAVGRGRAVLDRSFLAQAPERPGVYIMRDAQGRVLYVGKARNLRRRLSSYYSQPLGYTRKMDGLLESIADIEVIETGSELLALLLESQLIRRYTPPYNTQQRNHERYPYIKVELGNPWPRVYLTRYRDDDGAFYAGPFHSSTAARATVELLHKVFPLRTCPRSFRTLRSYGSPCLALSLGRCLGPCVGRADREHYHTMIQQVIAFLRGENQGVIDRLHQQIAAAVARQDFEQAARLRDLLRSAELLVRAQRTLDAAAARAPTVVITRSVDPGSRAFLLILHGRLWAIVHCSLNDTDAEVAARLQRAYERGCAAKAMPLAQDELDTFWILERWIAAHAGSPAIIQLPASPDWLALVQHGRSLPDAVVAGDGKPATAFDDDEELAAAELEDETPR
ncbi:MAG: GIY-YIG nuclease family protein [Thermorudis peleae]|nr:GIY-YIG nuclease family protein [Thermorudis peleae]